MIVEAVGISCNSISVHRREIVKRIQAAMEQAVLDVLTEGINDPDERARVTAERMAKARAAVLAAK